MAQALQDVKVDNNLVVRIARVHTAISNIITTILDTNDEIVVWSMIDTYPQIKTLIKTVTTLRIWLKRHYERSYKNLLRAIGKQFKDAPPSIQVSTAAMELNTRNMASFDWKEIDKAVAKRREFMADLSRGDTEHDTNYEIGQLRPLFVRGKRTMKDITNDMAKLELEVARLDQAFLATLPSILTRLYPQLDLKLFEILHGLDNIRVIFAMLYSYVGRHEIRKLGYDKTNPNSQASWDARMAFYKHTFPFANQHEFWQTVL
jgi:hypothetical protein